MRDGRKDRLDLASEMLQKVEPRLAYIKLSVAPANDVPGLVVALDGVEVNEASRDVPLPVDPGVHRLRATIPGSTAFTLSLSVPDAPGTLPASIPPLAPAEPTEPAKGKSVLPVAVAGGIGVVALGTMGYFGVSALLAEHEKPGTCAPMDASCTDRWNRLEQQRTTDTTVATVAGAVAITAAAAAVLVLLWPNAPRGKEQAVGLAVRSRGEAGLTVRF
jgi:hypothetical protein